MQRRKVGRTSPVFEHGLTVLVIILALAGCSLDGGRSVAVAGTWLLESDYDGDGSVDNTERWTISDNAITYEADYGSGFATVYRADIVDYSNMGLNGGDAKLTASASANARNPGFAVLEYTEVDGPGTGEVSKFNVFRWADNPANPAQKDFTQGYKDATPDDATNYDNAVFDTPSGAESGATNASGHFSLASTGAVKQ